mgnify:CR=1 FL=1
MTRRIGHTLVKHYPKREVRLDMDWSSDRIDRHLERVTDKGDLITTSSQPKITTTVRTLIRDKTSDSAGIASHVQGEHWLDSVQRNAIAEWDRGTSSCFASHRPVKSKTHMFLLNLAGPGFWSPASLGQREGLLMGKPSRLAATWLTSGMLSGWLTEAERKGGGQTSHESSGWTQHCGIVW